MEHRKLAKPIRIKKLDVGHFEDNKCVDQIFGRIILWYYVVLEWPKTGHANVISQCFREGRDKLMSSELWLSLYFLRAEFDTKRFEQTLKSFLDPEDRHKHLVASDNIEPGGIRDCEDGRLLIPYSDNLNVDLLEYYKGNVTDVADHLSGLIKVVDDQKYLFYGISPEMWGGLEYLLWYCAGWTWRLGWLIDCSEAWKFFGNFCEASGASVGTLWYSGRDDCRIVPSGLLVSELLDSDNLDLEEQVDLEAKRLTKIANRER